MPNPVWQRRKTVAYHSVTFGASQQIITLRFAPRMYNDCTFGGSRLIRTLRFAPCMYDDCTFVGSKLIHTFCFAPRMYNECKSPSVQGANSHVQRCPPIKSDSIEHT